MMFQMKVWNFFMVVVLGIIVAGYSKVQSIPLQTLPFAQPDQWQTWWYFRCLISSCHHRACLFVVRSRAAARSQRTD